MVYGPGVWFQGLGFGCRISVSGFGFQGVVAFRFFQFFG